MELRKKEEEEAVEIRKEVCLYFSRHLIRKRRPLQILVSDIDGMAKTLFFVVFVSPWVVRGVK